MGLEESVREMGAESAIQVSVKGARGYNRNGC